ncbi:MAG: hypothetical protein ACMUFK_04380 [Thermoplasmatota archaeon]
MMKYRHDISCGSVTEAHRNSNMIILRFDPPFSRKRERHTTHPLGMKVTILSIGPELRSDA